MQVSGALKQCRGWGVVGFLLGSVLLGCTNSGDGVGGSGGGGDGGGGGAPHFVLQVVAAGAHSCALFNDGVVKCWGWNGSGQLGQGDTVTRGDGPGEMGTDLLPINLGTGRTAVSLASGIGHVCVLLDNGMVKCWGANGTGQLGQGDTSNRGDGPAEMGKDLLPVDLGTGRKVVALTAGDTYTCALLDNGTVKCWGYGLFGQLGQGDQNNRGDGPGEMGDNLPPIDLGTGRTAVAIGASSYHTCAILDNGIVKCWGWNYYGQLGQGDTNSRGDGPGQMGDNLLPIDLGTGRTAVALVVGSLHTCVILDNGTLKCWGANAHGRLGQGDTNDRGSGPGEMGDNLLAIDLGTGRTAVTLAANWGHTCVLLDNGAVKCWGYNLYGQLGQGNTSDQGDGPGEMGDNLLPIDLGTGRTAVALAAGLYHSCALLDIAMVKCWGLNAQGQLGQGDTVQRGDDPNEMGDNLLPIHL